jgi:hypothetical protein
MITSLPWTACRDRTHRPEREVCATSALIALVVGMVGVVQLVRRVPYVVWVVGYWEFVELMLACIIAMKFIRVG